MTDDKEQIQSLYVAMYKAMMAKDTLALTKEDIAFLEEPYKAHEIVGALARTDSNGI